MTCFSCKATCREGRDCPERKAASRERTGRVIGGLLGLFGSLFIASKVLKHLQVL